MGGLALLDGMGKMITYTLSEARNRHGEVFDRAIAEPVLLTKNARASHVVLSATLFETLMARLRDLEDHELGAAAAQARGQSPLVGSDDFTAALQRLADDA